MDKRQRVGSFSEYSAYLAQKCAYGLGRNMCILGVWGNAFFAILGFGMTILCLFAEPLGLLFSLPFTLVTGFGAWAMYKGAVAAEAASEKMEPILPPTRHNIEQMPASEMLLRGSEEPTEGQEKILLRAAAATEEAKPEELLRPHL